MNTRDAILYRGQRIAVQLITEINTRHSDGMDMVFRDAKGQYYLRRELNWLTSDDMTGHGDRKASGRVHVHRLSATAAILWATTRLNSETLDLRNDAANLLRLASQKAGNATASSHDDGLRAHLDDEAVALVRRYLEVTPWAYTIADVVNGCVKHALSMALDDQSEAERTTRLDGDAFQDGSWGYLEEDIFAARQMRAGESNLPAPRFEHDRRLSPRPASSLIRKVNGNGGERAKSGRNAGINRKGVAA